MKSKFGGLNNFLSNSTSTPRGQRRPTAERVESDQELSNSRNAQYHHQQPKRKYEEVEDDRYQHHRREDIDNEEDILRSKRTPREHRERRDSESMRRTNSRDVLGTLGTPKHTLSRKFLREDTEQKDHSIRSRVHTRKEMTESEYANFQHVHQETKHCVDLLLKKTGNSIHNLNETINAFKENLRRIVEDEYMKLQNIIMGAIESIFDKELENIRKLVKIEEKKTTKSINEVREDLERIYENLQRMKEGIEGPNWKRFAGDFFKDDIESQVDLLIRKSEKLQVNRTVNMHYDPQK